MYFLKIITCSYLEVSSFLIAFHFDLLSRLRYILFEDDGTVQEVVHLQFDQEVLVEVVCGTEVQ